MSNHKLSVTVNGKKVEKDVPARLLLSDFLREELQLTGTHVGCEHGVCGACTIQLNGEPARSCLMFAVQTEGQKIRTVEDLSENNQLNNLQNAFHEKHGLQCGFCTPGLLMTLDYAMNTDQGINFQDDDEIRELISGNLCRCTGYQNIITAIKHADLERKMDTDNAV